MRLRLPLVSLAAALLVPALATPATAAPSTTWGFAPPVEFFRADLSPVPHDPAADSGSDVTGDAFLVAVGNRITAVIFARGLSPNLPHLAHIHGQLTLTNVCPGPGARQGGVSDLLIETVDGRPAYGPINVTFTTRGDTSEASALALDRAPVAGPTGFLTYSRTFEVPADVRANLDNLHIVVHGEDLDDDGMYDPGPITELGAPLEAELPVACGQLD